MAYQTVLFDLDGTLINSEPIWAEVITAVFADVGITISPEQEEACVGISNEDGIAFILAANREVKADPQTLADAITDGVGERLGAADVLQSGASELLHALKERGAALALVSSSPRRLIERVVAAHGWQPLFEVVLSAEEVERGKPDPAAYIEALRRLSAASATAVALEDTLVGVQAAQGAGATVLAIPSFAHEREAITRCADHTFTTLSAAGCWLLQHLR